jgi:hypothetical protein
MPTHHAIVAFVAALTSAWVVACFVPKLRSDLLRPGFWLTLIAFAGVSGSASLLVSATRGAGTGMTTSYGWPKPFYFRYLSEAGDQTAGYSLVYFAGNALALSGALLVAWAGWRIVRR